MTPVYSEPDISIYCGDAFAILPELPEASIHCCVTSPPYWGLRDYGTGQWEGGSADCDHRNRHSLQGPSGQRADRSFTGAQNYYREQCLKCGALRIDQQIGLESTPEEYVGRIVELFRQVRRVLRDDGTLWVNMGDSYTDSGRGSDAGSTLEGSRHNQSESRKIRVRESAVTNLRPKNMVGIPWRIALALQADGWYLRSDIIWYKPNPMPESVTDRPTKSHEYVFLLSKQEKYYYNALAIQEPASDNTHARYARGNGPGSRFAPKLPAGWHQGNRATGSEPRDQRAGVNPKCVEPGNGIKQNSSYAAAVKDVVEFRNKRDVWTIATEAYAEAHFATFPRDLVRPCILAGCPAGGTVLDPFAGSGTTLQVAKESHCRGIGIELNPQYIPFIKDRLQQDVLPFPSDASPIFEPVPETLLDFPEV